MNGPPPSRPLGHTGLSISRLGFGAATLGNLYAPLSDAVARDTVASALEHGITYFDTAPYYGFGLSERRLGDALRERRNVVISTKVGRLLRQDAEALIEADRHGFRSPMRFRPVYDYSYSGILRSYEDSLQRLGLPRVDILYVHDIGAVTHGSEEATQFAALTRGGGLRALEELRASRAISAFGVGVNEIEACERVLDCAALDVILLAGRYTLLEQGGLQGLLPRCQRGGTAVVIGGPYNSGILATGVKRNAAGSYNYRPASSAVLDRVRAIETHCETFDVPLAAAALQFPLAHPAIVSVIPGLSHPNQVAQTVSLYETPIPQGFWSALRDGGLIDEAAPVPNQTMSA